MYSFPEGLGVSQILSTPWSKVIPHWQAKHQLANFFFMYLNMNFQPKVPLSTKEGLFVMNSQNNSLIYQEVLNGSATYSSTPMLFFLYLIFISQMSSASSDSQSREIYKEGISFYIPSPLSALANPLISKLLSCNQSNIFDTFRFAAE